MPMRKVEFEVMDKVWEKHDILGIVMHHNTETGKCLLDQNKYLQELVVKYIGRETRLKTLSTPLEHSLN